MGRVRDEELMAKVPITASPHVFYVRPAPGWLDQTFEEVTSIIQHPLQKYKFEPKITLLKSTAKVHRCDWRQGLELLLRLTTAHDVEWLILESKCTKWTEVDAVLSRVPWNDVLPNKTIPVHVSADVSGGFTTASGKLRENLCAIAGVNHVTEGGEIRFKIELRDELLRISASLAGDPLYKRGYKVNFTAPAPLPEHQAAVILRYLLQGKRSEISSLFIPFAGSGTFGFESGILFTDSGPGAFSRKYSCELFPATPAATIGFLKRKVAERLQTGTFPPVLFNDFNSDAVAGLKENIAAFPKPERFNVLEGDLFGLEPSLPQEGMILIPLNPPYGNRLAQDSDVAELYSRLGKWMQKLGKKYSGRILGGCICPDELSWKAFIIEIGAKKHDTHHFTHGGKEMRLVRWEA